MPHALRLEFLLRDTSKAGALFSSAFERARSATIPSLRQALEFYEFKTLFADMPVYPLLVFPARAKLDKWTYPLLKNQNKQ